MTELDDYKDQKILADNRFSFLYFSNTPGTINIANAINHEKRSLWIKARTKGENVTVKFNNANNKFREHGINKHIIVMSTDELLSGNNSNAIVSMLLGSWLSNLHLLDSSIILLNQIMYTFHR